MTAGGVLLEVSGVRKSYGHVQALTGADLDVRRGEIHALLGDNGAGKSTLVKILSGAVQPDAGRIVLDGRELRFQDPSDARAAGIETVYQDLALAGTLDAGENVFLGREVTAPGLLGRLGFVDRRAMRRRTAGQLAELGIQLPSVTAPVASLSGGQRQAVAVARAAVWGTQLLIMDEPTAALGVQQTAFVLNLMRKVRDEKGLAIILISHNLPDVFDVADRVTVLRHGRNVLTCNIEDATTERLVAAQAGLGDGRQGAAAVTR